MILCQQWTELRLSSINLLKLTTKAVNYIVVGIYLVLNPVTNATEWVTPDACLSQCETQTKLEFLPYVSGPRELYCQTGTLLHVAIWGGQYMSWHKDRVLGATREIIYSGEGCCKCTGTRLFYYGTWRNIPASWFHIIYQQEVGACCKFLAEFSHSQHVTWSFTSLLLVELCQVQIITCVLPHHDYT